MSGTNLEATSSLEEQDALTQLVSPTESAELANVVVLAEGSPSGLTMRGVNEN